MYLIVLFVTPISPYSALPFPWRPLQTPLLSAGPWILFVLLIMEPRHEMGCLSSQGSFLLTLLTPRVP